MICKKWIWNKIPSMTYSYHLTSIKSLYFRRVPSWSSWWTNIKFCKLEMGCVVVIYSSAHMFTLNGSAHRLFVKAVWFETRRRYNLSDIKTMKLFKLVRIISRVTYLLSLFRYIINMHLNLKWSKYIKFCSIINRLKPMHLINDFITILVAI